MYLSSSAVEEKAEPFAGAAFEQTFTVSVATDAVHQAGTCIIIPQTSQRSPRGCALPAAGFPVREKTGQLCRESPCCGLGGSVRGGVVRTALDNVCAKGCSSRKYTWPITSCRVSARLCSADGAAALCSWCQPTAMPVGGPAAAAAAGAANA
jgi:hypothetical protein